MTIIMFLEKLLSAGIVGTAEGFIWALIALGVFVSFRVLDFADLSIEGSLVTGGAVAAVMIAKAPELSNPVLAAIFSNPFVATIAAFIAGGLAGLITGLLHTKLKIPPILAGIITMIGLYSINLHIMGTSNLSVFKMPTVISETKSLMGLTELTYPGWSNFASISTYVTIVVGGLMTVLVIILLYYFFGTQIGAVIRATGDNEKMCRAQGVNTDNTKMLGLVISNALIGMGGALYMQNKTSITVTDGVGSIVIGLASIIIGETLFMKARSFKLRLIGIAVGSIVYRFIYALIIQFSIFDANDFKLFTAIVVAAALAIPTIKNYIFVANKKRKNTKDMPDDVRAYLSDEKAAKGSAK